MRSLDWISKYRVLWVIGALILVGQFAGVVQIMTAGPSTLVEWRGLHGLASIAFSWTLPEAEGARLLNASKLVALVSVFGIAGIWGFILRGYGPSMLAIAALVLWGLLGEGHWFESLRSGQPTALFAFLLSLATFFEMRGTPRSWLWGLAAATDVSGLIMLPIITASRLIPFRQTALAHAIRETGEALLAFALVALAFGTYNPSSNVANWGLTYKDLLFFPLLLVLAASFGRKRFDRLNVGILLQAAALLVLPIFPLLLLDTAHSVARLVPLVALQITVVAELAARTVDRPILTSSQAHLRDTLALVMLLVFFALMGSTANPERAAQPETSAQNRLELNANSNGTQTQSPKDVEANPERTGDGSQDYE